MGSEFSSYTVEDISLEMGDAPFGSNLKNQDYTDTGALVIQGRNIQGRKTDWTEKRHISLSKYESLHRSHCTIGDLIFPKVGTIGKVGILTPCPGYQRYILSTNTMRLRVDPAKAAPLYVYYYFTWGRTANLIHAQNSKSVQPVFNFTSLKKFRLELPSLGQQKQISSILGSLDDKITINHQINTTLESMAQALFKSWFVDFDPVIDNALAASNPIPEELKARADARAALGDQRKPLPDHIRQQFPDRFVLTEDMGWVPEGWETHPLGSLIELAYGKSLPATKRLAGTVPVYGSGGFSGYHNTHLVQGPNVIVGRKGTVGSLYWVDDDCFPIDTVFYVVNRSYLPLPWIFQALQLIDIKSMGADSAVPGVNRNVVYSRKLTVPPKGAVDQYVKHIEHVFARCKALREESRSLTELRDTLLPKLLSGELRVPQAERMLEEVAL